MNEAGHTHEARRESMMLIRLLGGLMILGLVAGCSSTSITTDFSGRYQRSKNSRA